MYEPKVVFICNGLCCIFILNNSTIFYTNVAKTVFTRIVSASEIIPLFHKSARSVHYLIYLFHHTYFQLFCLMSILLLCLLFLVSFGICSMETPLYHLCLSQTFQYLPCDLAKRDIDGSWIESNLLTVNNNF